MKLLSLRPLLRPRIEKLRELLQVIALTFLEVAGELRVKQLPIAFEDEQVRVSGNLWVLPQEFLVLILIILVIIAVARRL